MKNLITRAISGLVLVWALLEGTASENVWYYILWGVVCGWSVVEFVGLILGAKGLRNSGLWIVVGVMYIGLSAVVLWGMADKWRFIVMMLTMVWGNDVGAYLSGMTLGRHKMMPKISPKKTWEGFCGGLVFAGFVAAVWYSIDPAQNAQWRVFEGVEMWQWVVVGVGVGIAAVVGDMVESVLKRRVGVKDSGNVIPGHGGMLDRFDATFMALPVYYAMLMWLGVL